MPTDVAPKRPELLSLRFSPWSERAAWALEARGVPYTFRQYTPLVGEPALRFKLRRWRGPVTVPVLTLPSGEVIDDSERIARWADARGAGPRLFPAEHETEMARWCTYVAERGLTAGRMLALHRMAQSPDTARAMVPRALGALLGPSVASAVGTMGVQRTLRKYTRLGAGSLDDNQTQLLDVLQELRSALRVQQTGPLGTLLPSFSYADIAACQVLAFVKPPSFGLRLSPSTRANYTDEALARDFGDLVAWRDAIYAAHRPQAPRA